MINVLISVVSKTLDVLKSHVVGQPVAAYLAFMHLKESMGIERALVCGILSSSTDDVCLPQVYAELVVNLGELPSTSFALARTLPRGLTEHQPAGRVGGCP